MTEVSYVNACELTMLVTVIANGLAANYSNDELSLIGAVFTQLGDTLATIVAQNEICGKLQK